MKEFDLKDIPIPIYEELVSFLGEEEGNKFSVKHDYHIYVIIYRIRWLEVKAFIRKKPIFHSIIIILFLLAILTGILWDFIFN